MFDKDRILVADDSLRLVLERKQIERGDLTEDGEIGLKWRQLEV